MLLMSGWSHCKHNMMSLSRPLCWNVVMPFVIKSYVKVSLVIRPFMKLYSGGGIGGSEPPASHTLLSRFPYLYLLPPTLFRAAPVRWFKIACLSHLFAIWQLTRHIHSCHLTFYDLYDVTTVNRFTISPEVSLFFSPSVNFCLLVCSEVSNSQWEDVRMQLKYNLGWCFWKYSNALLN